MPALWTIAWAQDPGSRSEQQDEGGAWLSEDGRMVLAVLADGAGGHRGGAQAAHAAVEAARILWENEPPAEASLEFLEKISRAAHDSIGKIPETRARAAWVALLATENRACWVHSGDSRLYHFSRGQLLSCTQDHSVAQALVERGKIMPRDVASHPDRSTLLGSLGGKDYLPVETSAATLRGDDIFILCSDGFWNEIEEEELTSFVRGTPHDRENRARELVARAVQRAHSDADNTSLWVVAREAVKA